MADTVSIEVQGLQEAIDNIEFLRDSARVSIARASLRGGMTIVAKQMRSDLDPKAKEAKRAVGTRFKATRTGLIIEAKVGFGVGKNPSKLGRKKARASGRKGVGITARNIHWWTIGTGSRTLKRGSQRGPQAGHPTGMMRAMQPNLASRAYAKVRTQVHRTMEQRFEKQLAKEVAKLKR